MYTNPNWIYYDWFVFYSIPRLFVCLRMRMSTSKQYANVYVNQYSRVRGPLRECRPIRSGASGLPYYCAPLVCISVVMELLAVWRHYKPKTKNTVDPISTVFSSRWISIDCRYRPWQIDRSIKKQATDRRHLWNFSPEFTLLIKQRMHICPYSRTVGISKQILI